ncbi:MAG TPA: penicillin acylase family protein [Vicinamibacteria bacterium]|nr:penicillin acylase family protein [Vicinamibacteria bacterium]
MTLHPRAARAALAMLALFGLASDLGARDTAADWRTRARAALSQIEGTISLPGLGDKVEVVRDRWGVPHIYARSEDDLFFAQGFVQAQDRLFQMELWRRQTQGRLAEILGPEWIERDRLTRLVTRYRGNLDVEWASYGPGMRRVAERFVAGVNACVDHFGRRPPLEFSLAGLHPEHWAPEDLLARAEAFGMSGNAQSEVSRARLVERHGIDTAQLLRPPDPPVAWSVPPGLQLDAVDEALAGALAAIGAAPKFGSWRKPGSNGYDDDGSNNWVVAGARTASGRPLLANDPHRALDHPSLRYLVHLEAPGLRAIGAVVPWFPGIAIGHNERIGWGLTIFGIDAQDLFQETLDVHDPGRYRVGEGWEAVRIERETIQVKGAPSVEVELKFTRHGPVVREDLGRHLAWALRWTGSEPGTAGYLAGLSLARARDWPQFRQALARWKMPGENFVYADVDGNIGYQATGLTPVRKKGTGLLPAPGAAGDFDWTSFASLDELPHTFNPAEGYVATANHNTLRPGDRVVGYEWANRFRVDRILEVLKEARKFGVAESEALQQDVTALPARFLVPLVKGISFGRGATGEERMLIRAQELLSAWDGRMTRDSGGAAVFAAFHIRLAADYVAQVLPRGAAVDPALVRSASAQVLVQGLAHPSGERDLLVAGAFRAAVHDLAERMGDDPGAWKWGDLHQAVFAHRLAVDDAGKALFNLGPVSRPGYGYTVNMTGGGDFSQTDGATFREVLDTSDWDNSVATSAPGQSGQPESPHFADLVPYWAEGRYFPLAFSPQKVDEVAAHRLALVPAR